MRSNNDQARGNVSFILMVAIGLVMLAMLVLSPNYAQAGLDGLHPVSLQSGLQANYSTDPLGFVIQPINLRAVEQAIADKNHTIETSNKKAAALIEALHTPVYTVTPRQTTTGSGYYPVWVTNTDQVDSVGTATQPGNLANPTAIQPTFATLSVPSATSTPVPFFTPTPSLTSTHNPVYNTQQPTQAATAIQRLPSSTSTWIPLPSNTVPWTPTSPMSTSTNTPIPPATSTFTAPAPTRTNTTSPPTPTNTPASYPPPPPTKTPTVPAYP